jgi:hypothetical protein
MNKGLNMNALFRVLKATSLSIALILAGCASTGGTVDSDKKTTDYRQFLAKVPDLAVQRTGNAAADVMFSGVSGIALRTHNAFKLYAQNMDSEGGQLGQRLEARRAEAGEEAYLQAVQQLNPNEKTQYNAFISRQQQITSETIKALPEVVKLVAGMKNLNPRDLASNPLQMAAAANATKTAMSQAEYATTALNYMKTMNDAMERAKSFTAK